MEKLILGSSPHVATKNTTRRIMVDVCIAMVPCVIAAVLFFGWRALGLVAVSAIACCVFEFLFNLTRVKKWTLAGIREVITFPDCSCFVTGILLALNVPAAFPVGWLILGDAFAILIVKMLFGGIGKNFANPALAARVFLFISFPAMSLATSAAGNLMGLESTVLTGATWLGSDVAFSVTRSPYLVGDHFWDMFLGYTASAAMGETSVLAILIGFAYLCIRKVIDWRLPAVIVASTAVFAFFFDALPNTADFGLGMNVVVGHLFSGGLMFGAVFMATDYSTSPNTLRGNMIYGVAIGFLVILIRVFTPMPEGMSFAILLMNVLSPLIDKYCVPRPFGYVKPEKKKKEKPRPVMTQTAETVSSSGAAPEIAPPVVETRSETDKTGETAEEAGL